MNANIKTAAGTDNRPVGFCRRRWAGAAAVAAAAPAFTAVADTTAAEGAAGHITAADLTAGVLWRRIDGGTAVQPTSATSARLR